MVRHPTTYCNSVVFNLSGGANPNETFQTLEEALCTYLNFVYLNQALNRKLAEPRTVPAEPRVMRNPG